MEPRTLALQALQQPCPASKCRAVQAIWAAQPQWRLGSVDVGAGMADLPGRPDLPRLIPPGEVPKRTPFTVDGRAALVHAICHIEFNAINLALDAVWRFDGMPEDFYRDWMRVAYEESQHFEMLHQQLQAMGHRYGDFEAHDGLWEMC